MNPPDDVLEEVACKHIYSAPEENLANFEQLMFLVEHAWWYYEDHVRATHTNLRHYANYHSFANMLFNRCEVLKEHAAELPSILERYREYKANIPVYGAILLDSELERVLLVRGYKSASGWGFPRGKVNHKESDIQCACREVLEETGLEIDSRVNPDDMIEATSDNKLCQLFIVSGLDPEAAKFAPQVQKEIGAFAWHYLHELPATVEEANRAYIASGGNRHRFFMVQPFVRKLRAWVSNRRRQLGMPPPPWDLPNNNNNGKRGHARQELPQQPQPQRSKQQQQQQQQQGAPQANHVAQTTNAALDASKKGDPAPLLQLLKELRSRAGGGGAGASNSGAHASGGGGGGSGGDASASAGVTGAAGGGGVGPSTSGVAGTSAAGARQLPLPQQRAKQQQQQQQQQPVLQASHGAQTTSAALDASKRGDAGALMQMIQELRARGAAANSGAGGGGNGGAASVVGQQQQQQQQQKRAAPVHTAAGGKPAKQSSAPPNLVMSSAFRFDKDAIMQCLAGPS